jgi:hypothetical protein
VIVLAALSLVAFVVGAVGLFVVVVAELAVERRRPIADRHHLGRLRPMPYDWKREGS